MSDIKRLAQSYLEGETDDVPEEVILPTRRELGDALLDAAATIARLDADLQAARNRIDDDTKTINRVVARNGSLEAENGRYRKMLQDIYDDALSGRTFSWAVVLRENIAAALAETPTEVRTV